MKLKNILVTGGAGYVGSVLIPKLLTAGHGVTSLDLYLFGHALDLVKNHPNLVQVKGDIRDRRVVQKALQSIDAVIHLACISNDPSFELDPALGKSINYDATKQLIDVSKKLGVKRFIYASSSSVYGVKKEAEVTENLPLEPLTDYSRYKVLCEKYLLTKTTNNFTTVILRPATVCGWSPRLRLDLTVNLLTIQALVNGKITVFGGNQKRPNIHIEDMSDLYVQLLQYPKEKIAGKVYNAGYQNYTIKELARMVKRIVGDSKIKILTVPTNDIRSYHISSQKIKRELGFVPTHRVEDAIKDLYEHYILGDIADPTAKQYHNVATLKSAMKDLLE